MSQPPTFYYQAPQPPPPPRKASRPLGNAIPLFTAFGVKVSLHWSWFLVALYELQDRSKTYGSMAWNVAEYLSLFAIVLMHEYGHALACKSVGGTAKRIVLWPLGGVAFVNPPNRPGAYLWSIAAGPLVNVILLPLTFAGWWMLPEIWAISPDLAHFVRYFTIVNASILVFNMLPIFPLDGGQILRAILWFMMGSARSLKVAAVIGIGGAVALGIGMVWAFQSVWITVICAFLLLQSISGLKAANQMLAIQRDYPA